MNRLDPDLKRLLRWARSGSSPSREVARLGFSSRVVARWNPQSTTLPTADWQPCATLAAWASALVILCGAIYFAKQARAPKIAIDFTSAAQFIASQITP